MDDIKQPARWAGWCRQILNFLPCKCRVCQRPARDLLCDPCLQKLHYCKDVCEQCGENLPAISPLLRGSATARCGSCLTNPPPFYRTIFAYPYAGPVARLIQEFKYGEALILSKLLGDMIVNKVVSQYPDYPLPDVLIPIPLHSNRLKKRGFNQSLELARHLSKALGIPVYPGLLVRIRATPKQSGLNRQARQRNLRGAFAIRSGANHAGLAGKHFAIVDDVITTGSTAREAAKVLNRDLSITAEFDWRY